MFELLYTSVAPAGLSHRELTEILQQARENNRRLGISGMLLYHNREIMQLLEGEEAVVKDLFQSIAQDDRHTRVEAFY